RLSRERLPARDVVLVGRRQQLTRKLLAARRRSRSGEPLHERRKLERGKRRLVHAPSVRAADQATVRTGSSPTQAPIRSASAASSPPCAFVSLRAGVIVSSMRLPRGLRRQIPAPTPSTRRKRTPAGPS